MARKYYSVRLATMSDCIVKQVWHSELNREARVQNVDNAIHCGFNRSPAMQTSFKVPHRTMSCPTERVPNLESRNRSKHYFNLITVFLVAHRAALLSLKSLFAEKFWEF